MKTEIKVTCAYCQKHFSVAPYRLKKTQTLYCSRSCQNKHKGEKIKSLRLTKTCPTCKKEFTTTQTKNAIHCSQKCLIAHNQNGGRNKYRKSVIIECACCKNEFSVPPSRLKHSQSKRICCSRECRAKLLTGEGNPAFVHGKGRRIPYGFNWCSQRRKAIKRDGWACQACGKMPEKKRGLHVHHIIPAHTFYGDYERANLLTNLITLCVSCHGQAEKVIIPPGRSLAPIRLSVRLACF